MKRLEINFNRGRYDDTTPEIDIVLEVRKLNRTPQNDIFSFEITDEDYLLVKLRFPGINKIFDVS